MYFNNIQILNYVVIGIISLFVGKIIAWCNIRIPEKKEVFSKTYSDVDLNWLVGE